MLLWSERGSPGHLMETLGGRLQLHVSGEGGWEEESCGGGSRCPSQFGSVPPPSPALPLGIPSHWLTLVCLSQSKSFAATVLLQTPSSSVHLVMTHRVVTEANPAKCVSSVTRLVRALRSRLKALRRLLLHAGMVSNCQQAAQTLDGGRWEQIGKNGETALGCCGPAHPSMAVSSHEFVSGAAWVTSRSFFYVCASYQCCYTHQKITHKDSWNVNSIYLCFLT